MARKEVEKIESIMEEENNPEEIESALEGLDSMSD
jgi:hypothetical protein